MYCPFAGSNICRVYAHVQETVDGRPSKDHVVCSGFNRETTVYTSKSSSVTVQMQAQGPMLGGSEDEEEIIPQFLIRYEGKYIGANPYAITASLFQLDMVVLSSRNNASVALSGEVYEC